MTVRELRKILEDSDQDAMVMIETTTNRNLHTPYEVPLRAIENGQKHVRLLPWEA